MKNLYKLEDYSDRLPNPKHFPRLGVNIIAIKDRPLAFSDGFMLDLSVREVDRKILEEGASRVVDSLDNLFGDAKAALMLLSEPEFVYETTYPVYILFTLNGNPIPIQVKYYKYFTNRYRGCKFYIREEGSHLLAMKVNEEVVGLCMSMFFEQVTLAKIKEERE